ncbi:MAG: hypothetical protein DWQ36_20355 [Acidobacteria bacterium]|nr:MAG: hypothetical protein DWQ30_20780 [Acidobacteriota bacterium]REK03222.1 MAG: hypothetical protein DWQ36_20355 [Acidobacteriota bacterium]
MTAESTQAACQGPPTSPSPIPPAEELGAYETGTRVYAQVFELQKMLADSSYKFVAVTGAVWTVVFTEQLALPTQASIALLLVHAVASVCFLFHSMSLGNAMRLRFEFLPRFGEQFYPRIENEIGKWAFTRVFPDGEASLKQRLARWGRQLWIWYLLPACGAVGSLVLLRLEL